MMNIDAINQKILRILEREGRLPNLELAERVGLSASACLRRVQELERTGIIRGYRAVIDPVRLGYSINAMVRLRCDGGICARIGAIVQDIPEVLDCRRLAGEDSALLHLVAMSIGHLETVLDRLLKIHPSISTTTLVQTPHANRPITRAMWNAASALPTE